MNSTMPGSNLRKLELSRSVEADTRDIQAFFNNATLIYHQNLTCFLGFWRYTMALFFENPSILPVEEFTESSILSSVR